MNDRTDALIEIAKIVGTHGLRGDLKVRPNSGDPELLLTAEQLYLRLPTGQTRMVQTSRRTLHKGQVLLRIQGCDSLTQVEQFVGGTVLLPETLLPELADDEYYWRQLKGLSVVDRQRGPIGKLEQMFSTAAHDTYVVKGALGEIMIPAVEQFILEINLQERVVNVDLPDGLLPDE